MVGFNSTTDGPLEVGRSVTVSGRISQGRY